MNPLPETAPVNPAQLPTSPLVVHVNGRPQMLEQSLTIAQLLERLAIVSPAIAVELNKQLVLRDDYGATRLQAGDCLEIVTLAGGG